MAGWEVRRQGRKGREKDRDGLPSEKSANFDGMGGRQQEDVKGRRRKLKTREETGSRG